MWDIVWNWLVENCPILIVAAVVAFVVWRVAKFYYTRIEKAEERIDAAEKSIEKLPCAAHEKTYQKISDSLNTIITYLKMKDSKAAVIFSQKESPRKLNPYGTKLFNDCGGQAFLAQHKDELLAAIAAKDPQTALDVENLAIEVLISHLDSDIFNDLKQWVYNSPSLKIEVQGQEQEYAVSMNDICFVLSLPLRDMYLETHPDLEKE